MDTANYCILTLIELEKKNLEYVQNNENIGY